MNRTNEWIIREMVPTHWLFCWCDVAARLNNLMYLERKVLLNLFKNYSYDLFWFFFLNFSFSFDNKAQVCLVKFGFNLNCIIFIDLNIIFFFSNRLNKYFNNWIILKNHPKKPLSQFVFKHTHTHTLIKEETEAEKKEEFRFWNYQEK